MNYEPIKRIYLKESCSIFIGNSSLVKISIGSNERWKWNVWKIILWSEHLSGMIVAALNGERKKQNVNEKTQKLNGCSEGYKFEQIVISMA